MFRITNTKAHFSYNDLCARGLRILDDYCLPGFQPIKWPNKANLQRIRTSELAKFCSVFVHATFRNPPFQILRVGLQLIGYKRFDQSVA